jgi:hypothetical protein
MESLDGFPRYRPPDIGSVTVKRIIMDWRSGWKKGEYTDISDTRLVFSVEVDLETGDLKWITVLNPEFAKALAQARAASKKVQ